MLSADLLRYYRQISQQVFTVVDVETTGWMARSERVTEISVIRATLTDGVQEQQTSLVNPQRLIPPKIVQYTGISQSMVDQAPLGAEIFPLYRSRLSQGMLTAHNMDFDYPFLQAEYQRLGMEFDRPQSERLCTVELSRLMLPDLPSRSLPNLVKHFGFKVGKAHRAAADTLACWLLAERLLSEILEADDRVLLDRFARQSIPLKVAAKLMQCSPIEAQRRLASEGVMPRWSGRGRTETPMYRRGDVEQLLTL